MESCRGYGVPLSGRPRERRESVRVTWDHPRRGVYEMHPTAVEPAMPLTDKAGTCSNRIHGLPWMDLPRRWLAKMA
jgi:hypothetical protein